MHNLLTSLN